MTEIIYRISTTGKVKNFRAWRFMHDRILEYLSSDTYRAMLKTSLPSIKKTENKNKKTNTL